MAWSRDKDSGINIYSVTFMSVRLATMIHLMPVKTQSDGFDSVCIYSNDSKSTNRIKIQDHIRIAREKAHQAI